MAGGDKPAGRGGPARRPAGRPPPTRARLWATPFTSNTQLLWYRKDLVDRPPPTTWDEMIDTAVQKIGTAGRSRSRARQYEGLTVWFNALIASAGGHDRRRPGQTSARSTTRPRRPPRSCASSPRSPAAPTRHVDQRRGRRAARLRDGPLRLPDQLPVHLSAARPRSARRSSSATSAGRGTRAVDAGQAEPGRRSAASTSGVGAYSKHQDARLRRRRVPARARRTSSWRPQKGGLPPTQRGALRQAGAQEGVPVRRPAARVDRGRRRRGRSTPAYTDISLAVQTTFHPPADIDPDDRRRRWS